MSSICQGKRSNFLPCPISTNPHLFHKHQHWVKGSL
jgi:hypothetical protein